MYSWVPNASEEPTEETELGAYIKDIHGKAQAAIDELFLDMYDLSSAMNADGDLKRTLIDFIPAIVALLRARSQETPYREWFLICNAFVRRIFRPYQARRRPCQN